MSYMYGPRRIVFHKRKYGSVRFSLGNIAMCGKYEGESGGSYHPMGHYRVDPLGRIELYMIDNPFQLIPHRPISFIGCADNRVEAKRMILQACQNNANHCMPRKEYINDKGEVSR